MSSENMVVLVGRVGQIFPARVTQSDKKVFAFSVATNERYTDSHGNKKDNTEWHDIEVWNRLAEICNEHVKVGDQIYIKGKISTKKWKDQSGSERSKKVIIPQHVIFNTAKQSFSEEEGIPF